VLKAVDMDTGINALLHFDIMDREAEAKFKIVESNGAIRTVAMLYYSAAWAV